MKWIRSGFWVLFWGFFSLPVRFTVSCACWLFAPRPRLLYLLRSRQVSRSIEITPHSPFSISHLLLLLSLTLSVLLMSPCGHRAQNARGSCTCYCVLCWRFGRFVLMAGARLTAQHRSLTKSSFVLRMENIDVFLTLEHTHICLHTQLSGFIAVYMYSTCWILHFHVIFIYVLHFCPSPAFIVSVK